MIGKIRFFIFFFAIVFILLHYNCAPSLKPQGVVQTQMEGSSNPLFNVFNEPIRFGDLRVGHITEATEKAIKEAESILFEIVELKNQERTFNNTMLRIDDIRYSVDGVRLI